MLASATLLIALIGHAALWIGTVNRLHAVGLAKWVKEAWTCVCFGMLFLIPALVVWRWWSLGVAVPEGVVGFDSPLGGYLVACLPVAALVGAARLWHKVGGEQHGVVAEHQVRTIDLGAEGGGPARMVTTTSARALSRLPGNQLLRLAVEEKRLRVPNLPKELEGLKIAHLSDLHMSGRILTEYYQRIVELANDWRPDLVALTGDLVENVQTLPDIEPTLGRLTAEHGVYFVLGNHDDHGDADQIRQRLIACGHEYLGGRWTDLDINGVKLRLAGNELPWFGPAANLASSPAADATFALVHSPDRVSWAQRHGASLVLAGHNHGGQICFPLIGPIVAPSLHGVRYASGVFRHGQTVMHVTRGTGTLAPVRFNCPPELALLTLTG